MYWNGCIYNLHTPISFHTLQWYRSVLLQGSENVKSTIW